jgi:hypothetical protein
MRFVNVGTVLSIHVTIAVVIPVSPRPSWNSKVNDPFQVKRYPVDQPLFVTVIHHLLKLMLAVTF